MKRPGTRQKYDQLLTRIRARVPGVALRTTFIVGFPGESDTDVDELCGFVEDHGSTMSASLPIPRRRDSAYALDDDVAARSKARAAPG